VATAFIGHYYNLCDANVDGLAPLYQDGSLATVEGEQHQGPANIVAKLKSLGQVTHVQQSLDVQPSLSPSAISIFATGAITINGTQQYHFAQYFQLVATGPGAYYLQNDMLRICYPKDTQLTPDTNEIAGAFMNHYYTTYDTNPDGLAGLYLPNASLHFEGQQFDGPAAIVEKHKVVGQVTHQIQTLELQQQSIGGNAACIFVTGRLSIGGDNPLQFAQFFQLVGDANGDYALLNDMFRLIYA